MNNSGQFNANRAAWPVIAATGCLLKHKCFVQGPVRLYIIYDPNLQC
jgi:hypothetical protein